MKNKEEVRHALYGYLETKFGILDKETHKKIKNLLFEHENVLENRELKPLARIERTIKKVSQYYQKAKTIKNNPKIEGNAEALKMVLNWLNSDAE